ncbi:ribosomal RNA-processing protein 8 [Anguilla anguilla]|uniref:ribosomal RNA-processing protein 8 n=1 Tax=Anguilla anguilla TaxID=7936 RepID=UPI0015A8EED5|nr:ribosomal RNA-processing protein 8 [Anguilla anguilla]
MFVEEEEWNDDPDAEALTRAVIRGTERLDSANVTPKGVGKRSLLRTLQTLGSAPKWTNGSLRERSGSDSEGEAVPSSSKRKKKRSKKRKRARGAGNEGEEKGKREGEEEDPGAVVAKKKRPKEAKSTNAGKPELVRDRQSEDPRPETTDAGGSKLSRQQWRNRSKMKRKSKNKFRPRDDETTASAQKADPEAPEPGAGESEAAAAAPSVPDGEERTVRAQTPKGEKNATARKGAKRKEGGKEESGVRLADARPGTDKKRKRENRKATLGDGSEGTAGSSGTAAEPEEGGKPGTETGETLGPEPDVRMKPRESREKRMLAEKLRRMLHGGGSGDKARSAEQEEEEDGETEQKEDGAGEATAADESVPDRSSALRARMEQRLESARFRYLNEQLYTCSSREARRMFLRDPQAFGVYHRGYTAQVQRWPVNPVDAIISYIKHKPASLVVADFGCGDCKIARSVKNEVHSFDLAPVCDLVTVCDMAHVPLGNATVDIAVFCLSLMGTNLADFLVEANRVLVMGGTLKIAEVASRFENVRGFAGALSGLGFKLVAKETENSHFYSFEFVKTGGAADRHGRAGLELRPCVYKKR